MIEPLTAREALFAIRLRLAKRHIGPETISNEVEELAEAGLDRRDMLNFELSDQLADRLAAAHAVLRLIDKEGWPDSPDLETKVSEVLALPPDLEAMVERRIG